MVTSQKARFQLINSENEAIDEYVGKDLRHFEHWVSNKYGRNWADYYKLNVIYI